MLQSALHSTHTTQVSETHQGQTAVPGSPAGHAHVARRLQPPAMSGEKRASCVEARDAQFPWAPSTQGSMCSSQASGVLARNWVRALLARTVPHREKGTTR